MLLMAAAFEQIVCRRVFGQMRPGTNQVQQSLSEPKVDVILSTAKLIDCHKVGSALLPSGHCGPAAQPKHGFEQVELVC